MFLGSWYTDLADIYRVTTQSGAVNRQSRTLIARAVPCRVYQSQINNGFLPPDGAGATRRMDKMACDVSTDIKAGDEVIITRGEALGRGLSPVRYIASQPQAFFDPVGGALTGLEHLEVGLSSDEIARARIG